MAKKRARPQPPPTQTTPSPPQPPSPQPQTQPPTPPQPSTQTLPSKRVRYDDMDPTLCRYFMSVIGSCTRFSLMHHNAKEHICAYASELNEHKPTSKRSAICSWLAWMHELD